MWYTFPHSYLPTWFIGTKSGIPLNVRNIHCLFLYPFQPNSRHLLFLHIKFSCCLLLSCSSTSVPSEEPPPQNPTVSSSVVVDSSPILPQGPSPLTLHKVPVHHILRETPPSVTPAPHIRRPSPFVSTSTGHLK